MESQKAGYIYIMINACLPKDMLKIGYTKRDPEHRAAELSQSTGLPSEYLVAYEKLVCDCELAERLIHEKLNKNRPTSYRNDRNREFFKVKLKDAIKLLDSIAEEVGSIKYKTENKTSISLEDYLKQTGQIGNINQASPQIKSNKDKFIEFNKITTAHSKNFVEEIEIYRRIGFTRYPKKFLDAQRRSDSEKLFNDGIKESIPGLALQKIYRAAHMGNIQAIKWILSSGKCGIKYWGDFDTEFLI